MASERSLPRTPIEWYLLAPVLVVLSAIGLLATGHTLPEAISMGAVTGLTAAIVLVIVAGLWSTYRADDERTT